MLKIIPLKEKHLEDAARLVCKRYRKLWEQVPQLPSRYADVNNIIALLHNILNICGDGVAAMRGNQLVGFLTGWKMPSFRGKSSTYSPEWANAAGLDDSARIYEEMYSDLAANWIAEQYMAHYISLFPNDVDARKAWHWLGFGMISVDALRSLDAIQNHPIHAEIRCAGLQDLEQVIRLHEDLRRYMKGAPIFLLTERKDRDYYQEWLGNPDKKVWIADQDEDPVAFMRLGPADEDVCTLIQDEKTTSIYAAFTQDQARRAGVATALLNHALQSARASGYERCAVSFEPMNLLGTRFWLRHFQPVCFSVVRYIDARLTNHE
jgi:GNAT superfamily N-acetyltransferase